LPSLPACERVMELRFFDKATATIGMPVVDECAALGVGGIGP
jgi:hypothetical protein